MKLRTKKSIREHLAAIINSREHLANCYFWKQNGNASSREWSENKWTVPPQEFDFDGHRYSAGISLRLSRSNAYVTHQYYMDGKEVTWRAISPISKALGL